MTIEIDSLDYARADGSVFVNRTKDLLKLLGTIDEVKIFDSWAMDREKGTVRLVAPSITVGGGPPVLGERALAGPAQVSQEWPLRVVATNRDALTLMCAEIFDVVDNAPARGSRFRIAQGYLRNEVETYRALMTQVYWSTVIIVTCQQ